MAPSKSSLILLFADKKTIALGILVLILSFVIGVLIGYFGKGNNGDEFKKYKTDQFEMNQVGI